MPDSSLLRLPPGIITSYQGEVKMIETVTYLEKNVKEPIPVGKNRKLTVMTVWFLNECWESDRKIDKNVHELERL